jgi:phosphoglycolate phosphatase
LRRSIGPPLRETFAEMLETTDAALVERAVSLYRERYSTVGLFENEVYPGVRQALAALRAAAHRLWVVTSKPHVFARRILEQFDLLRFFEAVYGCELDGAFSDKGDLIEHVLRTEGLAAADTWMIGDRMHDIHGYAATRRRGGCAVGYGKEAEPRGGTRASGLNTRRPRALTELPRGGNDGHRRFIFGSLQLLTRLSELPCLLRSPHAAECVLAAPRGVRAILTNAARVRITVARSPAPAPRGGGAAVTVVHRRM